MPTLYSIGYATKPLETFLQQLQQHQINAVADVRSVPYSKVFHDYHQEAITTALRQRGIHYVYLGEELGPRSKDPAHYDASGQVQFALLQQSALFQTGIQRLQKGMEKGLTIALMCAEKDPAVCHRSLLIGHYLLDTLRLDTVHINHDGGTERESELQQRLMSLHDIVPDMLTAQCECLDMAWRAQSQRCAYRKPE